MASIVDRLLLPERALRRAADDVSRLVGAAEGAVGILGRAVRALEQMERHLGSVDQRLGSIVGLDARIAHLDEHLAYLDKLPPEVSGLRDAFDRSNDEIEALREKMVPQIAALRHTLEPVVGNLGSVAGDLDEVRDVVEPLQPAAERIGRLADRLPGGRR